MTTKPRRSNGKNGHVSLGENGNGHVNFEALPLTPVIRSPLADLDPQVAASLRYTISRVSRADTFPSRFALVAALRGEGVTFLTRALGALIAGDYERSVCVVELNWWWPTSTAYYVDRQPSAADLVTRTRSALGSIESTGLPNLSIVPAGHLVPNYRAMTARSADLRKALDLLNKRYDHVILDIPAILATSDAVPLAELSGRCCLVVRQGVTSIEQANLALAEIRHLHIDGVIMNQAKTATPSRILSLISQG
jgi:Mrp family chromosome partitioning ATPase